MGGLATGFAKVSTRSAKAPRRKGARVSKSTLRVGDAVCMGGVAGSFCPYRVVKITDKTFTLESRSRAKAVRGELFRYVWNSARARGVRYA